MVFNYLRIFLKTHLLRTSLFNAFFTKTFWAKTSSGPVIYSQLPQLNFM